MKMAYMRWFVRSGLLGRRRAIRAGHHFGSEDSEDSSLNPDEHDIEFYPTYIQLATGQGKVHKPGSGEREEFPVGLKDENWEPTTPCVNVVLESLRAALCYVTISGRRTAT